MRSVGIFVALLAAAGGPLATTRSTFDPPPAFEQLVVRATQIVVAVTRPAVPCDPIPFKRQILVRQYLMGTGPEILTVQSFGGPCLGPDGSDLEVVGGLSFPKQGAQVVVLIENSRPLLVLQVTSDAELARCAAAVRAALGRKRGLTRRGSCPAGHAECREQWYAGAAGS